MKKTVVLLSAFVMLCSSLNAQVTAPYQFTDIKSNAVTPAKNQGGSGTCWSFATIGMVEADILKNGKGEVNLSEMWIVRHTYFNKVMKYIRLHGNMTLAAGGNAHDIPDVIREYGLVPQEAYPGLNYGSKTHNHSELDAVLLAYAKSLASRSSLTPSWIAGLNGILDAYFGAVPQKFTYKGKEYTPKTFAQEMGINPDDYISITSFTHHPYYAPFAVEIPDNWAWGVSYNVPLEEFELILDHAINAGYSVSWASDVSDQGFLYNKGFAVLVETDPEKMLTTEKDRWVSMTENERRNKIMKFEDIVPEVTVTPESRQKDFDNFTLTDDHGMLLYGLAKDQKDQKFYKVKNSWGDNHVLKGHFYASKPFVLGRSINYMVNKNALPKDVKNKLGIK